MQGRLTMVQIGQFMLGLTQNVSLLALLIVGYVWIRRVPQMTPLLRDASVGLLFGMAAVGAMLTSVTLGTGILLDGRTVLIGLPRCSAGGSPPCSPTQSRLAIGSGWADRCMCRGSG
jgi:hypothetical protein